MHEDVWSIAHTKVTFKQRKEAFWWSTLQTWIIIFHSKAKLHIAQIPVETKVGPIDDEIRAGFVLPAQIVLPPIKKDR